MKYADDVVDAALSVQLELSKLWEGAGHRIGGWKIGFTTGKNRDMFQPETRPFGFVLADRILESGSVLDMSKIQSCQIEPELALILGRPLGGEPTREEAREAVTAVAAAFEVNEGRYVSAATPLQVRIAAGLNNWGVVLGSPSTPPEFDLASIAVSLRSDSHGQRVARLSEGAFDDPYTSLSRLVRRLNRFGIPLKEGDVVITGAFSRQRVEAGQVWSASFEGVGEVSVQFV